MRPTETRIPAKGVRSLAWDDDALVDWVGGGQRYRLQGEMLPQLVRYAYGFDAVASLAGSAFSVIYTRCGTKGLVLQDGKVVREINRSYYHADLYEYPIALLRQPSGRVLLAHCPRAYCRLDIEDVLTGELLTDTVPREPGDVFHSRLAASADGRYLLSAGWVWHPAEEVCVYDVVSALADPAHLDGQGIGAFEGAAQSSAAFFPDGRWAIAMKGDVFAGEDDGPLEHGELRIHDPRRSTSPIVIGGVGSLGRIAAIGNHHVLALHGHPRLIHVPTGTEVLAWPHLDSGNQVSAIVAPDTVLPVIAIDSAGQRFALADAEGITVVQLHG